MNYFGHPQQRKEWEEQINTPVGEPCIFCEEKIVEGDMGHIDAIGNVMHHECAFRASVGSVGHLMGRCSCCGDRTGTESDPPGMTKREAAKASVALWNKMNGIGNLPGG